MTVLLVSVSSHDPAVHGTGIIAAAHTKIWGSKSLRSILITVGVSLGTTWCTMSVEFLVCRRTDCPWLIMEPLPQEILTFGVKMRSRAVEMRAYAGLGSCTRQIGELTTALNYYQQYLSIALKIPDHSAVSKAYCCLG